MSLWTTFRDAALEQFAPEGYAAYRAAKAETGDRDVAICRALIAEFADDLPTTSGGIFENTGKAWRITWKVWQCVATPEVKIWILFSLAAFAMLLIIYLKVR